MGDVLEGALQQLIRGIAEDVAQPLIDACPVAIRCNMGYAYCSLFKGGAEALFTLAQGLHVLQAYILQSETVCFLVATDKIEDSHRRGRDGNQHRDRDDQGVVAQGHEQLVPIYLGDYAPACAGHIMVGGDDRCLAIILALHRTVFPPR